MTDARAEARKRIAEAIEDAPWPCPHGGINSMDSADWFTCTECRADAVLDLFPTVAWAAAGDRQLLMLRSWPPEPAVPEEPQP